MQIGAFPVGRGTGSVADRRPTRIANSAFGGHFVRIDRSLLARLGSEQSSIVDLDSCGFYKTAYFRIHQQQSGT
jgi:hypothetical protein